MSELKHAPAPWELVETHDGLFDVVSKNIDGSNNLIAWGNIDDDFHAGENMRLISAAPELLDAVILAYEELNNIARLQDWHSKEFREKIENLERVFEKATRKKIEEVLV